MKLILPIQLNPISRRKDKSVKLSMETREMSPEEILSLMALEGMEAWMMISPNETDLSETDLPTGRAEIGAKTPLERLIAVLYVMYKQKVAKGEYVGLFENFRNEKIETLIEIIKGKLD